MNESELKEHQGKVSEILAKIKAADLDASTGDSDETTVICWADKSEIDAALKNLRFSVVVLDGAGYDGGAIIYPKKEKE